MIIAPEIAAKHILSRDNFLILTHKNPDGDTLGSAIALCHALRATGKDAYILSNEGITPRYSPWLHTLLAPSDFSPETVISVDCAAANMLSKNCTVYEKQVFIAIDHHISHQEYAEYTLLDANAAACGEIIWALLTHLNVTPTHDIAEAIYIAISTDTSCFLNSNTTASTHRIVAELYPHDVDFDGINRTFFVVKTRARLAIEAALIQSMHFYRDGEIAVMQLTDNMIEKCGACEDDLDNISALARSIDGVEIGILVRERAPGSKVSMRSSDRADVSKICAHFGGGGHIRAAGCTIALPPALAEEKLISEIDINHLY